MRHQSDDFARRDGIAVPRGRALPRLHPDFDQKPHIKRGKGWAQHPDNPARAIEQVIVANFSPPVIEKPSAPLKLSGNGGTREMTNTEQVKYYRDSAATLRGIAAAVLDPEIRNELLETAAKFDKLADWAEKQQTNRAGKPQPC